jgi:hypothetical protein
MKWRLVDVEDTSPYGTARILVDMDTFPSRALLSFSSGETSVVVSSTGLRMWAAALLMAADRMDQEGKR